MAKNPKMVICRKCNTPIPKKTRTCPNCGKKNKKPFYKRGWFIAVCVIAILVAFGSTGDPSSDNVSNENSTDIQISETVNSNDKNTTQSDKSNDAVKDAPSKEEQASTQKPETAISYETVDIQAMLDELDANALRAERTYQDKYIEVSGKLCGVDSDGEYISICAFDDDWGWDSLHCSITNDSQLDIILEKNDGDTVIIKGQITSIGEVLGYYVDIHEIS